MVLFRIILLELFVCAVCTAPSRFSFPSPASNYPDDRNFVNPVSLSSPNRIFASRVGRNLPLSAESRGTPLSSQTKGLELLQNNDTMGRNYVHSKLCSLGLSSSDCTVGRNNYDNFRDITLVQPVAIRPVGSPLHAIPLDGNRGPVSNNNNRYPSGTSNYPTTSNDGGRTDYDGNNRCQCVPIRQCYSYDIVDRDQPGSGNTGLNSRPHHGFIGDGIDPRNKLANSSSISASSRRLKRQNGPRIVTPGSDLSNCRARGYVCCRNPQSGSGRENEDYYNNRPVGQNNNNFNRPDYNGNDNFYRPTGSGNNNDFSRPGLTNGGNSNNNCGRRGRNGGIDERVVTRGYATGEADFGEYPWQVAILKREGRDSNVFVCGGALIDNRHLLTAAHCIRKHRIEDLVVRLGEWDVNSENEYYKHVEFSIAAVAIHPEFRSENLVNDIAIVKMDGFVDTRKFPNVASVCIPTRNADFTGRRCYVTGWGKDAFGRQGKYHNVLKEVDLPVLDHYDCEQKLRRTRLGRDFVLHSSFVCAGGERDKDGKCNSHRIIL